MDEVSELHLTNLQRQLCNVLQEGLPIYWRPFAHIAKLLNSNEQEILQQISQLKKVGVIRRIGAVINYPVLGKVSTLVTAHVPQSHLKQVAQAINSLPGVSHNYLRQHYYNLWFTLQVNHPEQISSTLSNLSRCFGITFHSLPARYIFKLDARFDAGGNCECPRFICHTSDGQNTRQIGNERRETSTVMSYHEKLILQKLQDGLDVIAEPFGFLCQDGLAKQDILQIIRGLIAKGVIRRMGAMVNHRKLGFVANVLFVCKVEKARLEQVGKRVASLPIVSHCFERETFEHWPYNLFAMMHSKNFDHIEQTIDRFTKAEGINLFELLPTLAELKKQVIKYSF